MAQLAKHLTSAQVIISQFVSSNPTLGSVLTAQSLQLASDSSPSLSALPPLVLSLSRVNIKKIKIKTKEYTQRLHNLYE